MNLLQFYRGACAIPDADSVVLTGGGMGPEFSIDEVYNKVVRYNKDGWVEDLPQLIVGRSNHACGSYVNRDNVKVRVSIRK